MQSGTPGIAQRRPSGAAPEPTYQLQASACGDSPGTHDHVSWHIIQRRPQQPFVYPLVALCYQQSCVGILKHGLQLQLNQSALTSHAAAGYALK